MGFSQGGGGRPAKYWGIILEMRVDAKNIRLSYAEK